MKVSAKKRTASKSRNRQQRKKLLISLLFLLGTIALVVFVLPESQTLLQEAYNNPTNSASNKVLNDNPPGSEVNILASSLPSPQTVTYCDGQQADIYKPQTPGTCMPVAIYMHGGGWTGNNRKTLNTFQTTVMLDLLAQGFTVVSIDYFQTTTAKAGWPRNIQDVACAARYFRANAVTLNTDPNHIGMWGDSAGGQLAALAGVADVTGGFDTSEIPGVSSKLQAVGDMFGPTVTAPGYLGSPQSNPIVWISKTAKEDPPYLIQQGTADGLVPVSDSQTFYNDLIAAGQPATLQLVQGAGHEFTPTGTPTDPQLETQMSNFFITNLKTNNTCTPTPTTSVSPPSGSVPSPAIVGDCHANGTCPSGSPTPRGGGQVPTLGVSPVLSTQPSPQTQPSGVTTPAPSSTPLQGGGSNNNFIQLILQLLLHFLQIIIQLLGGRV